LLQSFLMAGYVSISSSSFFLKCFVFFRRGNMGRADAYGSK
jgi:hypothetical protein